MVKVTITSAVALSEKQLQVLSKAITKKTGHSLKPEVIINPDVLGGFSVRIGSQEYNHTIKQKLADIKAHLLENA